jgi:hypothetical protein
MFLENPVRRTHRVFCWWVSGKYLLNNLMNEELSMNKHQRQAIGVIRHCPSYYWHRSLHGKNIKARREQDVGLSVKHSAANPAAIGGSLKVN